MIKSAHKATHIMQFCCIIKTGGIDATLSDIIRQKPCILCRKKFEISSSKSAQFCLKRKVRGKEIVLVDDIVTTGLTLMEARECLESNGGKVLNAFVLADARN